MLASAIVDVGNLATADSKSTLSRDASDMLVAALSVFLVSSVEVFVSDTSRISGSSLLEPFRKISALIPSSVASCIV